MKKWIMLSCVVGAMLAASANVMPSVRADVVHPTYWDLDPDVASNPLYTSSPAESTFGGINPERRTIVGHGSASARVFAYTGCTEPDPAESASATRTNYYKSRRGDPAGPYYEYWFEHTVSYDGNLTFGGPGGNALATFSATGWQGTRAFLANNNTPIPTTSFTTTLPFPTLATGATTCSISGSVSVTSTAKTANATTYNITADNTIRTTDLSIKSRQVPGPDDPAI